MQEDQRQPDLISDWVFEISLGWEMCQSRANGKKRLCHDYAISLCIGGRWELPYYSWGSVGNDDHFWCHVVRSDHSQSVSQPPLWSSFSALPLFSHSFFFHFTKIGRWQRLCCKDSFLWTQRGGYFLLPLKKQTYRLIIYHFTNILECPMQCNSEKETEKGIIKK